MEKQLITSENVREIFDKNPHYVPIPENGLGNAIGILHNYTFKKDCVYKLIFPKEMKDKDDFSLKCIQCKGENYIVYTNDTLSCFIVFPQDITTLLWLYRGKMTPST